jgi:hypothetical protein
MTKSLIGIAAVAATIACSNTRETRIPARPPERPLEIARADTTQQDRPLVRSKDTSQSVSTVEQQVRSRTSAPARTRKAAPRHKQKAVAPKPATDSNESQAYAPEGARTDSAPSDSSGRPVRDTANTIAADTAEPVTAAAPDTAHPTPEPVAARPDTSTSTRDSSVAVAPDSTPAPDTATFGPSASDAAAARAARTLAVGTEIHAALDDSISSKTDVAGRVVTAHVMQNVTGPGGRTVIPAGAPVRLTIQRIRPSRSKGSKGALQLKVDSIAVNGRPMGVAANVKPVPRELRGRGVGAGEAAKVGVGAAGGAVVGKVIGKSTEAAVIGGVIGAAGGAVVASQTGTRDVIVKPRTPVVFVLTAPLVAEQD